MCLGLCVVDVLGGFSVELLELFNCKNPSYYTAGSDIGSDERSLLLLQDSESFFTS